MINKKPKIIFAGTPDFAVPTLNAIFESNYQISMVLTQPDRKSGRGMVLKSSPVKQRAKELNIPVFQPEKLNNDGVFQKIVNVNADILIVVAYGLIIPAKILDIFVKGSYNVHASLLPLWRGAAPIHRAIEAGDSKIGVTIMLVVPELDSGDIVRKKIIDLAKDANTGDMTKLLSKLGAELMTDVLKDIYANKAIKLIPQKESMATYANKVSKLEAKVVWKDITSEIIIRKINAFNPSPGVFCKFRGKILKIWKAYRENNTKKINPGKLYLQAEKNNIFIGTIDGAIRVVEIQLEGKRKMTAREFIMANKVNDGEFLL